MKTQRSQWLALATAGVAVLFAATACGSTSSTQTTGISSPASIAAGDQAALDKLYASAKASGHTTINLYSAYASSSPTEGFNKVLRTFEQAFPGITVKEALYSGAPLFTRVDGELASGKQEVDAVLSGPSDVGYFIGKNALQSYEPPTATTIPKDLRDPHGYYAVPFQSLFGLVYNTSKISADQAPTTLDEVLSDKYKGQVTFGQPVGTSPSSFSLTTLAYNNAISTETLKKLNAAVPLADRYPNVVAAVNSVAQGRYSIAIWGPSQLAAVQSKKGAPIAVGNLSDARVLNGPGFGIVKNADALDATKLLESWLFTTPGQQAIAAYSYNYGTVPGAPAPQGFPSITDYRLKTVPAAEFATRLNDDGPRWEAIFGPPKS
ncbi:MAG: extracellular solute-binding protein [Gordonia sp. (in: high G+C Gram-positive bacteria)]